MASVFYDAAPEAEEIFYQLPDWVLPPLPMGYRWHREETGHLTLKKHPLAQSHTIKIVIYGPDYEHNNHINFDCFIGDINCQSFTYLRPANDTFKDHTESRRYPLKGEEFDFFTPDLLPYTDMRSYEPTNRGYRYRFDRGHCHDLLDTIAVGRDRPLRAHLVDIPEQDQRGINGRYYSTHDKRAYLPELPTINRKLKNHYIQFLRKEVGGAYIQYPYYDEENLLFTNGTNRRIAIPNGITFVGLKGALNAENLRIFDIPYDHNFPVSIQNTRKYIKIFSDPYLPTPLVYKSHLTSQIIAGFAQQCTQMSESYFDNRSTLNRPFEKHLSLLELAGEVEFLTPTNKVELAIGYSEYILKPAKARFWLKRAEEHALFLDREFSDKQVILQKRQYEDIISSFKNQDPGFEDRFDTECDIWKQIYKHQQDKIQG